MAVRADGQEQQLGIVGDIAEQRKAERVAALRVPGNHQGHAGHRENSGALRACPGLTVGRAERRLHHLHDAVEIIGAAGVDVDRAGEGRGRHHAAALARASGARA
jgi:hypothetical protein